jgi:glycosyltransferase involved in cell wall biosynthesis
MGSVGKVPLVSVGLPVYNGENFIREAIDSLLAQSFVDFELIISDNFSTDQTERICLEYAAKDGRIRYVRQERNMGFLANFRFVLDEAVGDYFMWLAADDSQSPNFMRLLVDVLNSNSEIVCVMTDVISVNNTLNSEELLIRLDDIRLNDVIRNWTECRKRFFRNPSSNVFFCIYGMFRTQLLKSVDLNYHKIHNYAFSWEIATLAQVALKGQIASIENSEKIYRRHELSVCNQEQKLINAKDRIFGYFSVSKSLFLIAVRSDLPIAQRLSLVLSVVETGLKWLFRFIMSQCYQKLKKSLKLFILR